MLERTAKVEQLNKRDLYRMPWSMNDNPIGWLETTDKCNIYCLGCYRKQIAGHKPLEEIKSDILFLKKWRNVHNISIAGGESILHPDILEIVAFVRQNDMEPLILTNGKALNREFLRDLKKAGSMGIAFHIDSMQQREPRWNHKTEAELNELRQEMMELVASVPGMYCNFGMTVYKSNFRQVPDVIRWCNQNVEHVHGMVFITFRAAGIDTGIEYMTPDGKMVTPEELGYAATREVAEDAGITSFEMYEMIRREFPHYQPAAYLGGTQRHDSIKWLLGVQVGLKGGAMLGSVGPRLVEAAEVWSHWFKGKYVAHRPKHSTGGKIWLTGAFDDGVRGAWRTLWQQAASKPTLLFSPVYTQSLSIIQAPDMLPDGRTDMCDSCPDMCVHDGTLVHSCRWDEWRLYGGYLQTHLTSDADLDEHLEEELEKALEGS